MSLSLEDQKQALLDNAILDFGEEYFEKLEKYSQDLIISSSSNETLFRVYNFNKQSRSILCQLEMILLMKF